MKNYTLILAFLFITTLAFSQKTIHQEEAEKYSQFKFESEADWDALNGYQTGDYKKNDAVKNRSLTKEVFGWNPYWMGTAYYDYDYSVLSEVSYFSYVVNPDTGEPDDIYYWLTTEIVDVAHSHGVKVSLTATLFSNHATLFGNSEAQQTLIDSLVSLVQYRNADGVNIDFESVSSTQRDNLTNFMEQLCTAFHTEIPNSRVSIALPAVDWGSTFDVAAMNEFVDLFLIMGYEYYWSGSSNAGPGSPLHAGDIWSSYNTTWSVLNYLNEGVSPEKLCLAVPYYGRDWATESANIPSATTASGVARTYRQCVEEYDINDRTWDEHSSTPVNIYENATGWNQCWYNDAEAMEQKYDFIKLIDIAGIGIWALGYDAEYTELNEALAEKFTPEGNTACNGLFTDLGGIYGNYYDHEEWIYTIQPKNTETIHYFFTELDIEANYDTLFIYDGTDTTANLINFYSGTNMPTDTFETSNGAVTFYFKSDGATTGEGWQIYWSCNEVFTEISQTKTFENLKIYPNPSPNVFYIENLPISNYIAKIYNIRGQEVWSKNIYPQENKTQIQHDLPEGIYFLKINSTEKQFVKKIMVVE